MRISDWSSDVCSSDLGVDRDPYLLTPGPLTTSLETKQAMLHDWGSRDQEFIAFNARVRERLVELAGGVGRYTTVPIQGSGTFAVEEIGRASCWERVCQYVSIWVVAVSLKKKHRINAPERQ